MPIQKVDRQQVIKKALEVFKEHGYHKSSMADLGKACGLLKGSIYHHFSGKEDLMNAVIDYLSEYYENKVFSVKQDASMTGEQKLIFLVEKSEEIFLNNKGGCLMASIGLETVNVVPSFTEKIRVFFGNWVDCLATIFEDKHSTPKAKELAEQSVQEIEGAVLLVQLFQDDNYLRKAHNRIIERYLNSLHS